MCGKPLVYRADVGGSRLQGLAYTITAVRLSTLQQSSPSARLVAEVLAVHFLERSQIDVSLAAPGWFLCKTCQVSDSNLPGKHPSGLFFFLKKGDG